MKHVCKVGAWFLVAGEITVATRDAKVELWLTAQPADALTFDEAGLVAVQKAFDVVGLALVAEDVTNAGI